jgi:hypothetical protein
MYLTGVSGEVKHANINHQSVNNRYKITAVPNFLTTHKTPNSTASDTDNLHTCEQFDGTSYGLLSSLLGHNRLHRSHPRITG